ncbi:hypothetical protein [Anabaena sp. UHCC 0451]|nr:hypothetical protein [Anabaena sp. UHCC 0451]MEA5575923.1 hypothetical protein [Anabaena sp. UHCC 0451]
MECAATDKIRAIFSYPSKVAAQVIGKSLDPTPGLQGRDMLK